jgi:ComF family protein
VGERGARGDPGGLIDALAQRSSRRLRSALQAAADSVVAVLFSPPCAACGRLLERPSRGPVCDACWGSIVLLAPPICDRCGDPLPAWRVISVPVSRCARCRRRAGYLDRARAVGGYEGALRAIVHALKYDGRRTLAVPLAALMRARGESILHDADCLVPVPLHPSRQRQRGFNQAFDLARQLGETIHALRRTRATAVQTTLPAAQRHRNVRGAFALAGAPRARANLEGKVVVLVDDVSTTGATLDACARVLKEQANVREVRALTAARVVARPR